MRLMHWVRRERSGLAFTTAELVQEEERQGHQVCVREPSGDVIYGQPFNNDDYDVNLIHSQFPITEYGSRRPTFMFMHGEPLSSVGNGISMKAICDLAPVCDAFICMRKEEHDYWSLLKRTYLVPKGVDLSIFKPLPITEVQKLSGAPSVLYMEHWRGQRNPLPLIVAMQKVWRKYPEARLHLYNCDNQKMLDTFKAVVSTGKLFPYVRSLQGPVNHLDVNRLLNQVDLVASCLYPLYARSIEALGAGKGFLCPGYSDPDYPFHCSLDPDSMAEAIIDLWENGCGKFNFRAYAEQKHNVADTVRQCVRIFEAHLSLSRVA